MSCAILNIHNTSPLQRFVNLSRSFLLSVPLLNQRWGLSFTLTPASSRSPLNLAYTYLRVTSLLMLMMYTTNHRKFISCLATFAVCSSALVPRVQLPPSFSVSTYASKATGFPNVGRDGGGGGVLNSKNIIVFSDTTTTNGAGAFVNFSSNSYAFVPNAKEPTKLQDFGSAAKPDVPAEIVPWWGTEKCQTNFIWPNSMYCPKRVMNSED